MPKCKDVPRLLVVDPAKIEPLTRREKTIVAGIAGGLRNDEIARKIGRDLTTVEFYVKAIYRKLGARNRVEVTLVAICVGLARLPESRPAPPAVPAPATRVRFRRRRSAQAREARLRATG